MDPSLLWALAGGALLGLSASWLMLAHGRIAGISGIVGGLITPKPALERWRLGFVSGLLVGGALLAVSAPALLAGPTDRGLLQVAVAGLLVGYGTRLGSGCTSGHGVCGLTRLSPRSGLATATFMASGALVATLMGVLA